MTKQEQQNRLMTKYDFKSIAKALKSKYGMLPPGWDEELSKPVKAKKQNSNPSLSPNSSPATPGSSNSQPQYQKYNQMAKLGLPEATIRQAMEKDGVDSRNWLYSP